MALPVLSEGSYKVTNARYAELGQDGTTLTIIEPGMLGVQQLAADGTTIVTTGAVAHDELTRPLLIMMK